MFDRILLALDGSPAGEVATDFASALATRCGASVHVLHVNERLIGGGGLTLRNRSDAIDLVSSAVQRLAEAGIRADGSVRVSSYRGVSSQIVTAAHDREANVIVVGSHRHRRIGRLFSAQVREQTTRLTSLPVLTAPAPLRVTTLQGADDPDRRLDQVLDAILR